MSASISSSSGFTRHTRSDKTRAAILTAAAPIFSTNGLAGARTEAIASAAHVNKALLYYYFKSKDDLHRAVIEEHLSEFSRRADEVLHAPGSVRKTLLAFIGMHFDYLSGIPYYPRLFHRLLVSGGPGLERIARKHLLPVGRQLVQQIERGIESGELRRVDPVQTVISLFGLTVHYFSAASFIRLMSNADPYDRKRLAKRKKEILDFVRFGLFIHPEEPLE